MIFLGKNLFYLSSLSALSTIFAIPTTLTTFTTLTILNLLISHAIYALLLIDETASYSIVWQLTSFFAGFNLHLACFLRRSKPIITVFGIIRLWFLAGQAPLFSVLLLFCDVVCFFTQNSFIKKQNYNINPPGC